MTSSRYDLSPAAETNEAHLTAGERDSVAAQLLADQEGPRVSVRAEVEWVADSRRVRAHFSLKDDAYVMIGHIDPDGVVRVVFPTDPKDDGFVRGGDRSYQSDEVFGGFGDQYRFRYQTARYLRGISSPDSYDRGIGYMFIIASWRPLHFDKLSSGPDQWDSYEIGDDQYLTNPRPAIYELASLLSGENREAYTVEFASYYNTTSIDGTSSYSAFNSSFCAGSGFRGFGFSPFDSPLFGSLFNYGDSFLYRGSYYSYNSGGGCYTNGGGYYGNYFNPFGNGFGSPFGPLGGFTLASAIGHRSPVAPRPISPPVLQLPRAAEQHQAVTIAERPHFNPEYRNRGLLTSDDPTAKPAGPSRRQPGLDGHTGSGIDAHADAMHSRPAIQEMVSRRAAEQHETRNWSQSQRMNDGALGRQGFGQATSGTNVGRSPQFNGSGSGGGQASRAAGDVPRSAPRAEPAQQHFSPPPHVSAPAPTPAPAPPAASSSSGKP